MSRREHEGHRNVDPLIHDLASDERATREQAREALGAIGSAAVSGLTGALESEDPRVRWEAAKTLVEVADPRAASALIQRLEDRDPGIRWVAAEALIALGPDGLSPLLERLVDEADSLWVREGAHHVLHVLAVDERKGPLSPVLAALEGPAPEDVAPVAAAEALEQLKTANG
jgi:HEAT repeat protein